MSDDIPLRSGPPPKRASFDAEDAPKSKRKSAGKRAAAGKSSGATKKSGPSKKSGPGKKSVSRADRAVSVPNKVGGKRGVSRGGGKRPQGPQRLQRVLAAAGFGSRRQCEDLITEGRVEVDGELILELGTQVDPNEAKIYVDGSLVRPQKLVYFVLNKPPGVVTTTRDPQGRTRVVDLIQENERVFPVGRLDRNSEGLLLLTNDGELAQQLAHPKYGVRKIYRVTVAGKVDRAKLVQMRKGIYIAEGRVAVDGAKVLRQRGKATEMEILLREGKNREIRRILARLGHKVLSLQRIAIGPLRLGELPRGAYRPVNPQELKRLREEVFYQSRRPREQQDADEGDATRGSGDGRKKAGRGKGTNKPPQSKPPYSKPASSKSPYSKSGKSDRDGRSGGPAGKETLPRGKRTRDTQRDVAPADAAIPELGVDFDRILVDPMAADGSSKRGTVIGDPSGSDGPAPKKRKSGGAGKTRGAKTSRGGNSKSSGGGAKSRGGASKSAGGASKSLGGGRKVGGKTPRGGGARGQGGPKAKGGPKGKGGPKKRGGKRGRP